MAWLSGRDCGPPRGTGTVSGRGRPAVLAALVVGLLLAGLVGWPVREAARVPVPAVPAPQAAYPAAPSAAASEAHASLDAAAPAAPACAVQQLLIALGGETLRACVGATRTLQNGSVRGYVAQGEGLQGWALRIDTTSGATVLAAVLSRGDGLAWRCTGSDCQKVQIGAHDARGARPISLRGVPMQAEVPLASAPAAARVSAELTTSADDTLPGLACAQPSVSIVTSQGSATRLCPLGGAGIEIADDGTRRYAFQNVEGVSLTVTLTADQRIAAVEFGNLSCSAALCRGVTTFSAQDDDDLAERSFQFGRTVLVDAAHPGVTATVEGSLVLPAQK